jgi:hypothetical protein
LLQLIEWDLVVAPVTALDAAQMLVANRLPSQFKANAVCSSQKIQAVLSISNLAEFANSKKLGSPIIDYCFVNFRLGLSCASFQDRAFIDDLFCSLQIHDHLLIF